MIIEANSNLANQNKITENKETTEPTNSKLLKRFGIQCIISGFFCNFTIFGVGFTYGVFQEFYLSTNGPLKNESESKVAIIGTLATSIAYLGGIFQAKVRKYLSTFVSMAIGSILLSLGMIIASFCHETWQFALTQGLMFGIGSSLVYMPPVIYSPQYFKKYRGVAMGIVFSGTGVGSLVFAFLSRYLINEIGWKWSLRVLGFIALTITFSCSCFVHPHPDYKDRPSSLCSQIHIFKSLAFNSQMLCGFFQSMGYLIPLTYMSTYGITLGFTSNQGATFIAINNIINASSKIGLGLLADYIGRFNMQSICCASSMVTIYAFWLVPKASTYLAFIVLYGVFSGPIISLLPACLTEAFGTDVYYSVSGLLYLFRGMGSLLGSPIAGLLINGEKNSTSSYFNAIQYTGAALACATISSLIFTLCQKIDNRRLKKKI